MPIKVDVVDNNSTIKVKDIVDNNSTVNVKGGTGADIRRLEYLIAQLQKHKEDLGVIYLDDYLIEGQVYGVLPQNVLNLLISYLINKVSYNGNVYYLTKINETTLEYVCSQLNVNPNRVDVNKESGQFNFINALPIEHNQLQNLDYLSSGHTGFAGIEFGTTEYWNSRVEYVPVSGMIVVYTDYDSYVDEETGETIYVPGIKIGDGNAHLIDKPFLGEAMKEALYEHIDNTVIHVTQEDKIRWDNKLNCIYPDLQPIEDQDLLEFTRD